MSIPAFGRSLKHSAIFFLLQENLQGMGDYLSQQVGSLSWAEAMTFARAMDTANNFIQLMANQLSPAEASILLDQWKLVYNLSPLPDTEAKELIELKQAQFGTPPILSNLITYLQNQLGSIFINLQWAPELQSLATTDPQQILDGYSYQSPLSITYVYVWQPRDNQDNLLMPSTVFNNLEQSYIKYIEQWSPSFDAFLTMNLTNRGNFDGYGQNYNGPNFNNYLDGYNVVSGSAGSNIITGVGTAFKLYPDGETGDFAAPVNKGFNPPIQIVDDTNTLQTYYILSVQSNTQLTLTTNLINNITSRTYRTLGIICDESGACDAGMLFNQ